MGLIKSKLKQLPQTIILDKWIPTTKLCPKCQTINKHITLKDRIFKCGCGYEFDRDIHSAKNMLAIKNLVFDKLNFVPTEHREITLVEFKTSIDDSNIIDKSEL
jgi:transposase